MEMGEGEAAARAQVEDENETLRKSMSALEQQMNQQAV